MSLHGNSSCKPFVSAPFISRGSSRQGLSGFPPVGELYFIERLIGRGGYSSVYLAYDSVRQENVALKIAEAPGCAPEIARVVLGHESRMYARMRGHPNILVVHDLHVVPRNCGSPLLLLSMELADGSLRDWLELNRNDYQARVIDGQRYFRQMLAGVHASHKEGIVHRDLKPENFLFVGGVVKVSDFGAARTLRTLSLTSRSESHVPQHGTPPYMSPEMHANPSTIDKRSDIYTLGVIAYEMFSVECRPPAGGTYQTSSMRCPLSPDIFLPGISQRTIRVISRCLEPI